MIADLITALIMKALAWWYRRWRERNIVVPKATSEWVEQGRSWSDEMGYAPEDFRL